MIEDQGQVARVANPSAVVLFAMDCIFIKYEGFLAYLELVLASLSGWRWVEEINCENLFRQHFISHHLQMNEFHQSIHIHHPINFQSNRNLHIPPSQMYFELGYIISMSCANSPLSPMLS
ncbi:hypothetical protein ACMFMF_009234 [Clarireedia jacksonii]